MAPFYVPFAVFLMNHSFVHSEVYDKLYASKMECMEHVTAAVAHAMEKAPEGGSVIGGCLPLPEGTLAPKEAPEAVKPKITGPTTSI